MDQGDKPFYETVREVAREDARTRPADAVPRSRQPVDWKRILRVAALVVAAIYMGDYLYLRVRMPATGLQTVQVQPYYAIPQKNGKTEITLADPVSQTCVQALFPHMGYSPCWWVSRHKQPKIDM